MNNPTPNAQTTELVDRFLSIATQNTPIIASTVANILDVKPYQAARIVQHASRKVSENGFVFQIQMHPFYEPSESGKTFVQKCIVLVKQGGQKHV